MHLVYVTTHAFHLLPVAVSWVIVVGAAYGLIRLVIDVGSFTGLYKAQREPFPFDLPRRPKPPTEPPRRRPAGP